MYISISVGQTQFDSHLNVFSIEFSQLDFHDKLYVSYSTFWLCEITIPLQASNYSRKMTNLICIHLPLVEFRKVNFWKSFSERPVRRLEQIQLSRSQSKPNRLNRLNRFRSPLLNRRNRLNQLSNMKLNFHHFYEIQTHRENVNYRLKLKFKNPQKFHEKKSLSILLSREPVEKN